MAGIGIAGPPAPTGQIPVGADWPRDRLQDLVRWLNNPSGIALPLAL